MKKAIFLLVLIMVAALTVLYFGWIRVPENKGIVFFSSITGYEETILETGRFHWRWEKLIPGTTKIYMIDTSPRETEINLTGKLPSADTYSQALPGNPDFSYSISLRAVYTLKGDYIAGQIARGMAEQGEKSGVEVSEEIYRETDTQIESLLREKAGKVFSESIKAFSDRRELEEKELSSKILGSYILESLGNINLAELAVVKVDLPDIVLYRAAALQYEEILSGRKQKLMESESRTAVYEAELEKKLETLEKYGQILTKYPILLEYLKINPDRDILKESERLGESR